MRSQSDHFRTLYINDCTQRLPSMVVGLATYGIDAVPAGYEDQAVAEYQLHGMRFGSVLLKMGRCRARAVRTAALLRGVGYEGRIVVASNEDGEADLAAFAAYGVGDLLCRPFEMGELAVALVDPD
jgi:DNA-binding response OmpR family regulator